MELFIGCYGNGTCVDEKKASNRYERICHISEHGHIKFYEPYSLSVLPNDVIGKINHIAVNSKKEFMEKWSRLSCYQKWYQMMNISTIGCGYTAVEIVDRDNRHLSIEERVKLMEPVFFEMHM